MILKRRVLAKYPVYEFKLPIGSRDTILVKKGDKVNVGTPLYVKRGHGIKYSFYLPEQIGCRLVDAQSCVSCIDGEFVDKGEVLAEVFVSGGLTVKKLVSPSVGLVDLSRISIGYLDILGEELESTVESSFKGEIIETNNLEGITIKTEALALDLLGLSNTATGIISGEFVSLNTGKDIKLKADDQEYMDKIVFVGKHLHMTLLQDLFNKGAKFVLTYSMDYQDFRNQGLPVGIIGGFGEIYSGDDILRKISSLDKSFAVVDVEEKQVFFLNEREGNMENSSFVSNLIGNKIISHSLGNYGMLGKVVGAEEQPFVTVEWENGGRSVINIGNIEFVSY